MTINQYSHEFERQLKLRNNSASTIATYTGILKQKQAPQPIGAGLSFRFGRVRAIFPPPPLTPKVNTGFKFYPNGLYSYILLSYFLFIAKERELLSFCPNLLLAWLSTRPK